MTSQVHSKLTALAHEYAGVAAPVERMLSADDYRGFAAKLRREADDPALIGVRENNLKAAARWESLAEEAEHAECADRNDSARPR